MEDDCPEFQSLYPICMTDPHFKEMQRLKPGYLEAIYFKDWFLKRTDGGASNPRQARQRAAGDKVAIQFNYTHTQLDLTKQTFREALRNSKHHRSECWLNCIYELCGCKDALLDPEKMKNVITRESILELLGRTEEDIKEGLTMDEVKPFFEKYKLKLRVYDIFYNQIYKYDPEAVSYTHLTLPTIYSV